MIRGEGMPCMVSQARGGLNRDSALARGQPMRSKTYKIQMKKLASNKKL